MWDVGLFMHSAVSVLADRLPLMGDVTCFYLEPSATSDLGSLAVLSRGLPTEPEALGAIVRGLLVHNLAVKFQGLSFPAGRMRHMQTVGAEAILDNVFGLDPAPIGFARPVERRMVGFCYHFALLHCALLRAVGTPARARCGFVSYFGARRWIDHWVTEYWDGEGWRLTDPQTGRANLTGDDFQSGVTAWIACRAGASPALYGNGELWGWDELRGSLINDVAALNKVEIPGWYWCNRLEVEPLDQPHEELDTSLDDLARLASAAESVERLKECFDLYPDLQPPADAVAR